MKYSYELSVDVHDLDHNGVARCSSLMRYIQTAAQSQLTENGMSYDELYRQKRAFILSRIKMEFTRPLRAYDRISATSYPCDSRGYSFLRCYSLEAAGETVGRAVSVWALIDTDTHGLIKVGDFPLGIDTEPTGELALSRFILPSEITYAGTYTVNYGDLDQNRHMNNTRYPDMYANFLPLDGRWIKSISISYQNEAPMGEKLSLYSAHAGGNIYYLRSVREDGRVNSEAEIELAEI